MKWLTLFLSLLLLFSLIGCGNTSKAKPVATTPFTETVSPVEAAPPAVSAEPSSPSVSAIPSTVPVMPAEQQKQLIMNHYEKWAYTEPWESPWFYTFTDLDHNGRLEVIAACLQGTGFYTYAHIWEVNEDYSGIDLCELTMEEEGSSFPDIIINSMPSYYDASTGCYSYICEDLVRGGFAEYYFSTNAICLHNGMIDVQTLASRYEYQSGPDTVPEITYRDADGNPTTREMYETTEEAFSAGKEKTTLSVEWIEVENPLPEEDLTQETDLLGPEVVITKNPRGETVAAGGKTWFIAHAENAVSLTWQAVNPDGFAVSLEDAMTANPGLSLEALEDDTIAVSNIPLSFDGWGIQARFDGVGDGNFTVTEPAWITVTQ